MKHKVKVREGTRQDRELVYQRISDGKLHTFSEEQDDSGLVLIEEAKNEGSWYADCETCIWKGNNPYPDEESAQSSADFHIVTGPIEDERAEATRVKLLRGGHPA
jgi:hypothetical protein